MRSGLILSAMALSVATILAGCSPPTGATAPAAPVAPPKAPAKEVVKTTPPAPAPAPAPAPVASPAPKPAPPKPAPPKAPAKPKYKKVTWGDNLLKNPGLSEWKKDSLADWSVSEFTGNENKQKSFKLAKSDDGSVSLPAPAKDKITSVSQRVEIDKARHGAELPVFFGAKYKASGDKQLHFVLKYKIGDRVKYSSLYPTPSTEWKLASKRITLPAAAVESGVELFIMRRHGADGDVVISEPFLKFGN